MVTTRPGCTSHLTTCTSVLQPSAGTSTKLPAQDQHLWGRRAARSRLRLSCVIVGQSGGNEPKGGGRGKHCVDAAGEGQERKGSYSIKQLGFRV